MPQGATPRIMAGKEDRFRRGGIRFFRSMDRRKDATSDRPQRQGDIFQADE